MIHNYVNGIKISSEKKKVNINIKPPELVSPISNGMNFLEVEGFYNTIV